MSKDIVIKGANENNLKSLDVTIPRDKMVVLTGLSGSPYGVGTTDASTSA